jgi:hypothetical protein
MNAPPSTVQPATRRVGDVRVARALRALRAGDVATLCVDEWHLSGALEARLRESGLEFGIECDGTGHLHYVPLGVSS